jgi:hypothetical protein
LSPSDQKFPFKIEVHNRTWGLSTDSEVRVLDGRDQLVGNGFGSVQFELAPGLYAVQVERAGVKVEKVLRHAGPTDEKLDEPLRFSAVPAADTATSHEYYQGPAMQFSTEATAPPLGADTPASLFVFVRAASYTAERVPLGDVRLRILDYAGAEIVSLDPAHTKRDEQDGWLAFMAPAPAGEWVLRHDAPDGSPSPSREMALATFSGWQTQVFMTISDGLLFGSASVLMSRAGFRPDDREAQAVDSALAGLQNGTNTLLAEQRQLLLYGKFDNPMLGLIGAHVLLRDPDADPGTIQTVLGNMDWLLGPGSPDNRALQLIAARRSGRPAGPAAPFDRPPIVRAGLEAVLAAAAEDPGLVPPDGVLDRIAAQRLVDSPWSTWKPALASDSSPAGNPAWVTQYVEEATRTAARRGEEPDLVALASGAALPLWKVRGAYAQVYGERSLELERLLAGSRQEKMDADEAERLLAHGDDEERVRALGYMQGRPLKKYAEVVTQAVQQPRSEFEHVQSLRVAQQLVPKLDPGQRDELAQAVARPQVEPGSDPWYIGRQVLSDLGE